MLGVQRALEGPGSARGRLAAFLRSHASTLAAGSRRRPCLLAKGTAELAGHDPSVADRALKTFNAIQELLAACIEGQRQGEIDPSADARQLGGLLLAVHRGMEAQGRHGPHLAAPDSRRRDHLTAWSLIPGCRQYLTTRQ